VGAIRAERVIEITVGRTGGGNAGDGIGAHGIPHDHPFARAGADAGVVVIAGIVGHDVVIAAGAVDAGCVVVADVVGDVCPGAGKKNADRIVVAIVVADVSLRRVLNADARMGGAAGSFATGDRQFVVERG